MPDKKLDLSNVKIEPVTSLDDLDELAKDEVFPFKGKEWTIPAISQIKAFKLSIVTGRLFCCLTALQLTRVLSANLYNLSHHRQRQPS